MDKGPLFNQLRCHFVSNEWTFPIDQPSRATWLSMVSSCQSFWTVLLKITLKIYSITFCSLSFYRLIETKRFLKLSEKGSLIESDNEKQNETGWNIVIPAGVKFNQDMLSL